MLLSSRLEIVVSTKANAIGQVKTIVVSVITILNPAVVPVETITQMCNETYLLTYSVSDTGNNGSTKGIAILVMVLIVGVCVANATINECREVTSLKERIANIRTNSIGVRVVT